VYALPLDAPQLVVTLVDGDAVEPREERPLLIELREGEIDFGEDLLRHVLRVVPGAEVVVDEVQNRLLVLVYDLLEGVLIPAPAPSDKSAIFIGI
jgi:hypothetical protein